MRVGEFRGYDVGVERLRRLGFEDVAKTLRQRVVGQWVLIIMEPLVAAGVEEDAARTCQRRRK